MSKELKQVNSLWIGGELSSLELLTIKSYVDHGYSFHLWTYEPVHVIFPGVIFRNAAEIIPEEGIFTYKNSNKFGHGKGSVAGFSDIFRYKLLYEHGGVWTDMDITCLREINFKEEYFFRYHHQNGVVGNLMKCPPKSEVMKYCYERAIAEVNSNNTNWMLPLIILKEGVLKYNLEKYIIRNSNLDKWPLVARLCSGSEIEYNWEIIHWMNEEFRRLKIEKNICLDNSMYHILLKRHHVPHRVANEEERSVMLKKLNMVYYYILNLHARWKYRIRKLFNG